ncbi:MAG: HAMP domain-containing protein [Candidatus Niyogibacteria bacterium]|nr:HAMP domain-containing protein [Candidatus Niyogibacteria bacterium]
MLRIGFRAKLVIFLTILLFALIGSFLLYLNSYLTDYLRTSALANFRIIAETSEGAYFAFAETLKVRTIDWSSDGRIRSGVAQILAAQTAKERDAAAKALGTYLREEKMQYDPSVVITDILDKNGIVIASSREDRLGIDEKKEEEEFGAHRFSEAIKAGFGEAFITAAISEPDEHMDAMIHSVARIFSTDKDAQGGLLPQDAVILVHFDKVKELAWTLSGERQVKLGAKTGLALFDKYKSADIFLVNSNRNMVTVPRFDGVSPEQKIDSLPVGACFDSGEEVERDYVNHRGVHVFGASMCMKRDNLMLVVEVASDEVLSVIGRLQTILLGGGLLVFILGSLISIFFTGRLLGKLLDVTRVAGEVAKGNIKARTSSSSSDEIGELAKTFNSMLDNVEQSRESLERVNTEIRKKEAVLAQKVEELERFKDLTVGRELQMVELKKQLMEKEKM